MVVILSSIVLVILAGACNGSFATPAKHLHHLPQERLWFIFSFWGFLIVPVVSFAIISPDFIKISLMVDWSYILVPLIGGAIWGIGMVFFTLALRYIGIGVAFMINIGLATALGTLLPLLLLSYKPTSDEFQILIALGIILFIIGVVLSGQAAKNRDKTKKLSKENHESKALLGIVLTVLAGLSSAIQGTSFAYSVQGYLKLDQSSHSSLLLTSIPWLWLFIGAFIPYVLYFIYVNKKHKSISTSNKKIKVDIKSHLSIMLMGILFFECVIFYSKATLILGNLGPVIAWPIYMVFIVLTANFWSFKYHEWSGAGLYYPRFVEDGITVGRGGDNGG